VTKILQNAGTYDILTPPDYLLDQPEIIERAGRTAYQSFACSECKGSGDDGLGTMRGCPMCGGTGKRAINAESAETFIRMLIRRGHESVLEHSALTVRFSNHSRGFTHELVRHRLCAFTQESTRYVDEREAAVVCPPSRDPHDPVTVIKDLPSGGSMTDHASFRVFSARVMEAYRALREAGWPAQDARQILPIGITSEIVVTANFREWRHIFSLRTAKPAHWEIRRTMGLLLTELQDLLPAVFDDFAVAGQCRDGIDYWERS
jgi:thymidylate synthase (FAD)